MASESIDSTQVDVTMITVENLRQAFILPLQWTQHTQESSATIKVCKFSSLSLSSHQPIVTHSLMVNNDSTWIAFVHGHHVDGKTSQALANVSKKLDSQLQALMPHSHNEIDVQCVQVIQTSTLLKCYHIQRVS